MSIADKLTTVAENVPKVYEAGKGETLKAIATDSMETVDIPEGITRIASYAFCQRSGIKTVIIPEGVTEIGTQAFKNCTKLTKIVFPSTLETIGNSAINCCYVLGQYNDLVLPPNLKTIDELAFGYSSMLGRDLIIPASVETIGTRAFIRVFGQGKPSKVYFRGTPTSIASDAFTDTYNTCTDIYCPWAEGAVAGAPWGATVATIHYNYVEGAE